MWHLRPGPGREKREKCRDLGERGEGTKKISFNNMHAHVCVCEVWNLEGDYERELALRRPVKGREM